MVSEYGLTGFVRERSGGALPGIAPSNTYACRDGYVVIAGNSDAIFPRLMRMVGRDDLASDPGLRENAGRVLRAAEIDAAISAWTSQRLLAETLPMLESAQVPCGKIYSAKDIVEDVHYRAREMIEEHRLETGERVLLPGIVPKLSETPGRTRWIGPRLGAHAAEVLSSIGYGDEEQAALRSEGTISDLQPPARSPP